MDVQIFQTYDLKNKSPKQKKVIQIIVIRTKLLSALM
jgi:hypothetical protein